MSTLSCEINLHSSVPTPFGFDLILSQTPEHLFSPILTQALQELAGFSQQANCESWLIPQANNHCTAVDILRLDKVSHPGCEPLSGNKLFKLLPNIAALLGGDYSKVVSFGGRWSNHCWSLSAALADLHTSLDLFIRGERPLKLTPTLSDAQQCGARLNFVPRSFYDQYAYKASVELTEIEGFRQIYDQGSSYFIPSGGSNPPAVIGASVLGGYLAKNFPRHTIYCAAGTGGFALGLALGVALANAHTKQVSITGQPTIIAPCVAGDQAAVEERCIELLKTTLGYLKENRALLSVLHSDEEKLIELEDQLATFSGSIAQLVPLAYKAMENRFGQPSIEQNEFRLRLEQANGEVVDSVYLAPLSAYLAQIEFGTADDHSGPVLLLHTGGQQGARSA